MVTEDTTTKPQSKQKQHFTVGPCICVSAVCCLPDEISHSLVQQAVCETGKEGWEQHDPGWLNPCNSSDCASTGACAVCVALCSNAAAAVSST